MFEEFTRMFANSILSVGCRSEPNLEIMPTVGKVWNCENTF